MGTTNAKVSKVATHLSDLADAAGGKPRFVSFRTRLAGEVQGRGASKMRRGDHVMEYTLLTGVSYMSMVQRSLAKLQAAMASPTFVADTVAALAAAGATDEQSGAAITATDVIDALTGTARGRKGLLTAYSETLAGVNESTSEHVYDALTVDGDSVPGCKVYVGAGNPSDPKAPVPGTVYLAGVVIASEVVTPSPNGDKLPSKRGAVAVAKAHIERTLDLPARKYRTFRLLPGEAVSLKSGAVAFHGREGDLAVRPGAADIASLTR
jgi:hypothetical protein